MQVVRPGKLQADVAPLAADLESRWTAAVGEVVVRRDAGLIARGGETVRRKGLIGDEYPELRQPLLAAEIQAAVPDVDRIDGLHRAQIHLPPGLGLTVRMLIR